MKRRVHLIWPLVAAILMWAAPGAVAQDSDDKTQRAAARSATVSAQPAQPKPAANTRLVAPDPDGLRYVCNSGNCACAGVKDCVEMKDICAPGTIGCNKHGCSCKEGEGDGG